MADFYLVPRGTVYCIICFIGTIKNDNLEVAACFGGLYNDDHFLNHC